jgi:hypothetical protein
MPPIILFYHCLFQIGDKLLPNAINVVREQMESLKEAGLLDAASEFHVGINGDEGCCQIANLLIPAKAKVVMHGLSCRTENRTILMIEERIKQLSGEAYILYEHAKGCTHPAGDPMRTRWRGCMQKTVVRNWRQCVADLDSEFEAVGVHWMVPPATPPGQFIFAGNFWWARASFLKTLPSIMERDRIKLSGIDSIDSRYEAEVWIGNGPRPPKVCDYHGPFWTPGQIGTCQP